MNLALVGAAKSIKNAVVNKILYIKGERVIFKGEQNYSFPPEDVFPMLCPVREYEYIPRWECDIVY